MTGWCGWKAMPESEPDDLALEPGADESGPAGGDPGDAAPTDAGESEPWRMLHPMSLLVNLVPRAWGVVRQLWPFFLVVFAGGVADGQAAADVSFILMFFLLAVANTVIHFATLRYRVAGGRLEIRSGLLSTSRRVISPRAVQNVELVRNVFHRASGLVEVRVETASGEEVEGLLSALTVEEGARLVAALSRARHAAPHADDQPVLAQNDTQDLVMFGAASTRVGTAVVALGVITEWSGILDPKNTQQFGAQLGALGLAALFLMLLCASWIAGIVGAVVRHHGFRLTLAGDTLVAEEGLFTRRRVELPRHKVQLVQWTEPWLRRLFGFGSLVIESAAARAGQGGTERALAFVPVVRPDEALDLAAHALPGLDVPLDASLWSRADPRARVRAMLRAGLQAALLVFTAAVVGSWWMTALLVMATPLPLLGAWFDWQAQRWTVSPRYLVARRGFFNRSTTIVARDRLQSVQLIQGPVLVQMGLSQIVLRVAGSAVLMPILDADLATELANALSYDADKNAGRR